jgi:uncharacterized membrane-anchored protein
VVTGGALGNRPNWAVVLAAFVVLVSAEQALSSPHILEFSQPDNAPPSDARTPAPPADPNATPAQKPEDAGPGHTFAGTMFENGVKGPRQLRVDNRATFDLPSRVVFVGQPAFDASLRAEGRPVWPSVAGIVVGEDGPSAFRTVVSTSNDGNVRMESLTGKPEELLAAFRNGHRAVNADLAAHGFGELEFVSWKAPPVLDAGRHTLDWTLFERTYDGTQIEFRRHMLFDRDGYITLDSYADADHAAEMEKIAAGLESSLASDPAKGYAAFVAGKDRVAPYGTRGVLAGADIKAPLLAGPSVTAIAAAAGADAQITPGVAFGIASRFRYVILLAVSAAIAKILKSARTPALKAFWIIGLTLPLVRIFGLA